MLIVDVGKILNIFFLLFIKHSTSCYKIRSVRNIDLDKFVVNLLVSWGILFVCLFACMFVYFGLMSFDFSLNAVDIWNTISLKTFKIFNLIFQYKYAEFADSF